MGLHDREVSRGRRRHQQRAPELGGGRPGEVGARRVCVRTGRLQGHRALPRLRRRLVGKGDGRSLRLHRVGGVAALEQRPNRSGRHLVLRDESVSGRCPAATTSGGHLSLGGRIGLVSGLCPTRRDPLRVRSGLVPTPGRECPARRRRAGILQRRDRRIRLRAGHRSARGAGIETGRPGTGCEEPPPVRRLAPGAQPRLVAGENADALCGELGRPGSAPPGQCRGIHPIGGPRQVAGSPRRCALGRLLHGQGCRPATPILRLLPEGRGQRMGFGAQGPAPHSTRRRHLHRSSRERVAHSLGPPGPAIT